MDGYVDLDLLSISLKDMQESWEEMGEGQAFQCQQWWGKDIKTSWESWGLFGEEDPLNLAVASLALTVSLSISTPT